MPAPQQPPSLPAHLPAKQLAQLKHLQQLSYLWDNSLGVPGTRWRLGLESLIGFIPYGGDALGVVMSCYIVWRAMEFGLPQSLLGQMLWNLLLDGLVGTVPMLGDIFDTTWKANTRNVRLLENHLQLPSTERKRANRGLVLLALLGMALLLLGIAGLSLFIFHWLWQLLSR